MTDPLFWLILSLVLLAICLLVVMTVVALVLRELGRAARSAEQLLDTLNRELPTTLEALRLTGIEITELTDDVNDGIEHASNIMRQVDDSLRTARRQAHQVNIGTRSFAVGVKAAWRMLLRPSRSPQSSSQQKSQRRPAAAKKRPKAAKSSSRSSKSSKYKYRPSALPTPPESTQSGTELPPSNHRPPSPEAEPPKEG